MTYEIAGKVLRCQHCDGTEFEKGRAQLNTAAMSFLDLDWLNETATTYCCCRCGHLEWFTKPPKQPPGAHAATDITCLSCGTAMEKGQTTCPKCGWSYD